MGLTGVVTIFVEEYKLILTMRKLYVLLALLTGGLFANGANSYLRVTLTDGKVEGYRLGEKPVITFSGDNMLVATSKVSSEYLRDDVKAVDFTVSLDGWDVNADCDVLYGYERHVFKCDRAEIYVYDMGGTLAAMGFGHVSLASLPKGVYIVKVNDKAIKIQR